jgi:hypothetical protein
LPEGKNVEVSAMAKVTVMAALEEYDDTTDVLVWLIEQKYSEVNDPTLEIDETPQLAWGRRTCECLSSQKGKLTGRNCKHEKVTLDFSAEVIDIPVGPDVWDCGYRVEVTKTEWNGANFKTTKVGEYTIKGSNRNEFEIIVNPNKPILMV